MADNFESFHSSPEPKRQWTKRAVKDTKDSSSWLIEGYHSIRETEIALKIECLAGGACNPKIIYDIKSRDSKCCLLPDKEDEQGQRICCNLCFSFSLCVYLWGLSNYLLCVRIGASFLRSFWLSAIAFAFEVPPTPTMRYSKPFFFLFSYFFVSHSCSWFISGEFFTHPAACIYHLRIISPRRNGIIYLLFICQVRTFLSWTAAADCRIWHTSIKTG